MACMSARVRGCYLFECGDIAGDVLHGNWVLHCESVALALYSSSVDDNPGICSQTWTAHKQKHSKPILRSPMHCRVHIINTSYSVKSVAPVERVKSQKVNVTLTIHFQAIFFPIQLK